MEDQTKGILLMGISGTTFGTLGILGKLASQAGLSIPTVLVYRFVFGSLILWAAMAVRRDVRLLRGRSLFAAILLGSGCYAAQSGLYFLGLEYMTAGLVGIVVYTYPVFVLVLSFFLLDEVITGNTIWALVLALGGVVLITGVDPAGADARGIIVVLGAAVVYAVYYIISHTALEHVDAQTLTAHVLPAAAGSFVLFGVSTGHLSVPASNYEWSVLAAIGLFGTAIPIAAFFEGLAYIGASRASIISSLEPTTAVALGAVVLAEPVSAVTVVGGLLVLAGVLLIERD